jgi:hypothetical protein
LTYPRESTTLRPPPEEPGSLADFPSRPLSPETPLFRVVRKGNGPWWFGSTLEGRFDLPEPEGTCYLADDPLAALLELIGPELESGAVSADFLRERRIRELQVPEEIEVADLTSRKASGFGITAEIGTIVPYALPQAWALRLRAAGSEGLVYWLRHDPSRAGGYALFGPHGERTRWKKGKEKPISRELIARLAAECSIEVLPVPRSGELRISGD